MRTLFSAYLPPGEDFFEELWKDAIIIFDTNVLLNLYRSSDRTREEVLGAIGAFRERLWLPNQVAWEFFRRRADAMAGNEKEVLRALRAAKKAMDEAARSLRGRLAATEQIDDLVASIDARIDEFEKAEAVRMEAYKNPNEPVLMKILDLYDGRVGSEPTQDWLDRCFKLGERRYREELPPGYKDSNSKKSEIPRSLYGDFLLWRETIEHAKIAQKPAIIVTNDQPGPCVG